MCAAYQCALTGNTTLWKNTERRCESQYFGFLLSLWRVSVAQGQCVYACSDSSAGGRSVSCKHGWMWSLLRGRCEWVNEVMLVKVCLVGSGSKAVRYWMDSIISLLQQRLLWCAAFCPCQDIAVDDYSRQQSQCLWTTDTLSLTFRKRVLWFCLVVFFFFFLLKIHFIWAKYTHNWSTLFFSWSLIWSTSLSAILK